MRVLKMIVLFVLLLVPTTLVVPIILNGAPLFKEPGAGQRLKTYLSQNIAETSPDHNYPELRSPQFDVSAEQMFQDMPVIITTLGWNMTRQDAQSLSVTAVVTSALWRFKDDVEITVLPLGETRSSLQVKSASRVGRGDFGANNAHIRELFSQVLEQASKKAPQ